MIARVLALLGVCALLLEAHAGEPIEPHDLLRAWRTDPGICIPLFLAAVLFAVGQRRATSVASWQTACFWTGLGLLAIALISPLHALGEVLFSAHMVQHEILMLLAAPLLVLSRPLVPWLWALPLEARKTAGRWSKIKPVPDLWRTLTNPAVAWTLHGAVIWLWHAPVAFEATLKNDWVHSAQHISFLGTALLFWWSLFHLHSHRFGAGVLYLFTTAVHTSILGALLTFARTPWYPAYGLAASFWGYTPLEDQQLGGLMMWVPGGFVYLTAGLVLFARWMRQSEVSAQRRRYAA